MNEKQKRFCKRYVETLNATQAAIQAGYSAQSAYSQGCRLLKNDEVKKMIAEELEKMDDLIPDRNEIKRFWSIIMRNPEEKTSQRLAASVYLAKSLLMFDPDVADWC